MMPPERPTRRALRASGLWTPTEPDRSGRTEWSGRADWTDSPATSSGATGSGRHGMVRQEGTDDAGWLLSDALLLSLIRVTGTLDDPCALSDLIAAADALYHLIPSRQEIEHGMSRLLPAGLARYDSRGFASTPLGRATVARARGGSVSRIEALHVILARIPVIPMRWTLDERAYDAVVLEYRHDLWRTYRRQGQVRGGIRGLGGIGRGGMGGGMGQGGGGFGGIDQGGGTGMGSWR